MQDLCQSVKELKSHVEYAIDHSIHSFSDLRFLAMLISEKVSENINPDIFKPVWQIENKDNDVIRVSTLHILAEYLGFKSWREFDKIIQNKYLSEGCPLLKEMDTFSMNKLKKGNRIEIGWGKRSFIYTEYYGDGRFIIHESIHTKLSPGDSFVCQEFAINKPAVLKNLCTENSDDLTLVLGSQDGLKSIQIL